MTTRNIIIEEAVNRFGYNVSDFDDCTTSLEAWEFLTRHERYMLCKPLMVRGVDCKVLTD